MGLRKERCPVCGYVNPVPKSRGQEKEEKRAKKAQEAWEREKQRVAAEAKRREEKAISDQRATEDRRLTLEAEEAAGRRYKEGWRDAKNEPEKQKAKDESWKAIWILLGILAIGGGIGIYFTLPPSEREIKEQILKNWEESDKRAKAAWERQLAEATEKCYLSQKSWCEYDLQHPTLPVVSIQDCYWSLRRVMHENPGYLVRLRQLESDMKELIEKRRVAMERTER